MRNSSQLTVGHEGLARDSLDLKLLLMEEIRRSPVEVGCLSHYVQCFIITSQVVVWDLVHQEYVNLVVTVHVLGQGFPSFRAPKLSPLKVRKTCFLRGICFQGTSFGQTHKSTVLRSIGILGQYGGFAVSAIPFGFKHASHCRKCGFELMLSLGVSWKGRKAWQTWQDMVNQYCFCKNSSRSRKWTWLVLLGVPCEVRGHFDPSLLRLVLAS